MGQARSRVRAVIDRASLSRQDRLMRRAKTDEEMRRGGCLSVQHLTLKFVRIPIPYASCDDFPGEPASQ